MTGPSVEFCEWAAGVLLTGLRRREFPDGSRVFDFLWEPFLQCFRASIVPSDAGVAYQLMNHDHSGDWKTSHDSSMWGAWIARGPAVMDNEELTDRLVVLFRTCTVDERRMGYFHHILARGVPEKDVAEVAEWLENRIDLWVQEARVFFGTDKGALEKIRLRMAGPAFVNKRWVYVYSTLAIEDEEAVQTFLAELASDRDPKVARTVEFVRATRGARTIPEVERDEQGYEGRFTDWAVNSVLERLASRDGIAGISASLCEWEPFAARFSAALADGRFDRVAQRLIEQGDREGWGSRIRAA